jgi:riboflavin synthase alpha subunit
MKQIFGVLILLILSLTCVAQTGDKTSNATASGEQRGEGRRIGGRGIGGTIEEIKSDSFTVKTMDGKTVAVKVTPETQFRKDRQEAKFSDFKAGDFVMIGGEPNGQDAFTARFVASRQGGGAGNMQMMTREDMGKKFIAGEVKAIDGTKLTVARPDGETQTIEVDENTSFRKGRESITLPDIKVGDRVFGRGALNSANVFVPTELNVGGPGGGFGMGPAGGRGRPPQRGSESQQSTPPK